MEKKESQSRYLFISYNKLKTNRNMYVITLIISNYLSVIIPQVSTDVPIPNCKYFDTYKK